MIYALIDLTNWFDDQRGAKERPVRTDRKVVSHTSNTTLVLRWNTGRDAVGRAHGRPTVDIHARHNLIQSASCPHTFRGFGDGCGALKIGTEMSGGVHNVLFEDNTIGYAGIALKLSTPEPRGGNVTNATWRNNEIFRAGMVIGAFH
jgi:hypothetical protein